MTALANLEKAVAEASHGASICKLRLIESFERMERGFFVYRFEKGKRLSKILNSFTAEQVI